jgi:hypothetical protein
MTQEKKPAGRPKERPEGEVSLKSRLPQNLYRVLKGVSGLRGLSMNDAVTEAVELWAKQYPALVTAVDSIQGTPKKEEKTTEMSHSANNANTAISNPNLENPKNEPRKAGDSTPLAKPSKAGASKRTARTK